MIKIRSKTSFSFQGKFQIFKFGENAWRQSVGGSPSAEGGREATQSALAGSRGEAPGKILAFWTLVKGKSQSKIWKLFQIL